MEVLKQASPTVVPVAPKLSPTNVRPSSRARIARMWAGKMRGVRRFPKPNCDKKVGARQSDSAVAKIHRTPKECPAFAVMVEFPFPLEVNGGDLGSGPRPSNQGMT